MSDYKPVRGIVLSKKDFDQLVVQAKAEDVARFAVASPVVIANQQVNSDQAWMMDPFLYDKYGRPVCVIRAIEQRRDQIDVMTMSSASPMFMSGSVRVSVRAEGI